MSDPKDQNIEQEEKEPAVSNAELQAKDAQRRTFDKATDFVENMEGGVHAMLDEFGANLSGGQRQRIAIARALYNEPRILIFDEATSALDNESERIITDVIERIRSGRIIFIIAHRQSSIKNATKILVLGGGKVVGFDSKEALLQNCEIFKKLSHIE